MSTQPHTEFILNHLLDPDHGAIQDLPRNSVEDPILSLDCFTQNKANFPKIRNDGIAYQTKNYGELCGSASRKNKPNAEDPDSSGDHNPGSHRLRQGADAYTSARIFRRVICKTNPMCTTPKTTQLSMPQMITSKRIPNRCQQNKPNLIPRHNTGPQHPPKEPTRAHITECKKCKTKPMPKARPMWITRGYMAKIHKVAGLLCIITTTAIAPYPRFLYFILRSTFVLCSIP